MEIQGFLWQFVEIKCNWFDFELCVLYKICMEFFSLYRNRQLISTKEKGINTQWIHLLLFQIWKSIYWKLNINFQIHSIDMTWCIMDVKLIVETKWMRSLNDQKIEFLPAKWNERRKRHSFDEIEWKKASHTQSQFIETRNEMRTTENSTALHLHTSSFKCIWYSIINKW